MPLASQGVQAWDRYAGLNNNPIAFTDPSGNSVCQRLIDDQCVKWSSGRSDKPRDPHNQELLLQRRKPLQSYLPSIYNLYGDETRLLLHPDGFSATYWIEKVLAWQYTPLVSSSVQLVTTEFMILDIPALFIPEGTVPAALAYIGLYGVNRAASVTGLASTFYHYDNQLYGTTVLDVGVSAGTTIVGTIPGIPNLISAHLSFWFTLYRSLGGPLP